MGSPPQSSRPGQVGQPAPQRPSTPGERLILGIPKTQALALALAVLVLGAVIGLHFRADYSETITYWQGRQSGIADVRARIISNWLSERRADGEVLAAFPAVQELLSPPPPRPSPPASRAPSTKQLTSIFERFAAAYNYADILLLNGDGQILARSPESAEIDSQAREIALQAVRTRKARVDFLGNSPSNGTINFSIPVLPAGKAGGAASPSPSAPGVMVLEIPPEKTLFPLLTSVSVPTATGETVLVIRKGNDILFCGPLRYTPHGVHYLRRSLNTPRLAAAAALSQEESFGDYLDYRGVRVLAATRRIPEADWGLICKIDRDEALGDFNTRAWLEGLAALLVVMAAGILLRGHRRTSALRSLEHKVARQQEVLKLQAAVADSEKRLRELIQSLDAIVWEADARALRFTFVSQAAEKILGLTHEQWLASPDFLLERIHPEDRERISAHFQLAATTEKEQTLTYRMLAADGRVVWVRNRFRGIRETDGSIRELRGLMLDITARKRAEEGLRRSEQRYRLLFERNLAGVFRCSLGGHFLDVNEACARILGYASREELLAQSAWDMYCDAADRRAYIARLQREKNVANVELHLRRKDGNPIWVLENASLIDPGGDQDPFLEGTFTDITERKRAEEALRESEQRFRVALAPVNMAVFNQDRDLRYTWLSRPQLGYTSEQVVGRTDLDVLPPGAAERAVKVKREAIARRARVREEITLTVEGQPRVYDLIVEPLFDPSGEIVGITGASLDITEGKQAEAENARLRTAIEQSAETVVITDVHGTIQYVNPAFERITGYSRAEALGKKPSVLKSGQHPTSFYEHLWKTILGGEVWHGEVVNRRKDGRLYTEEMNIAPVRNPHGAITHFIATKQDVTARKELEEQFRQAQKMEAVGRLAGGVAHDFNNLLTIITGYSQMLLAGLEASSPLRAQVTEIQKAGERAAGLTQQLLAFSRRQVLNPQVLDLNQVIRDTSKMLRRLIGEDVECHTVLHPELWKVKVDAGQVGQILMNLGVNARDAMPEGGTLTIETSNVHLTEVYASTHAEITPGRYVVMAVSDSGMGMDHETQAHIFEPFFTTKAQGKGTGLGLATVYGIVKQSGGYIWIYSEPGKGATFKIYLPAVEAEVEPAGASAERRKSYRGTETILLVEDETAVRKLVAEVLVAQGYNVLTASNPDEAAQISAGYAKTIHLLLTDLVMPRWNGRQLAEHLAFSRPGMKVLFMSGYTDDAIVQHGILSPGTAFIQKPFTPQTLTRKVRGVLDS